MTPHTLGRWLSTVTPANTTPGALTWLPPQNGGIQCHTAVVNGRAAALVRLRESSGLGRQWNASIEGWVWNLEGSDDVAAQFGAHESPVKGFKTVRAAKAATAVAFKLLEQHLAQDAKH